MVAIGASAPAAVPPAQAWSRDLPDRIVGVDARDTAGARLGVCRENERVSDDRERKTKNKKQVINGDPFTMEEGILSEEKIINYIIGVRTTEIRRIL